MTAFIFGTIPPRDSLSLSLSLPNELGKQLNHITDLNVKFMSIYFLDEIDDQIFIPRSVDLLREIARPGRR